MENRKSAMQRGPALAESAGEFMIGGDLRVARLGFGAMRITGEGIWGAPKDPDECRAVLRRCVELGVNLIDTADSYGPYVSEELIREALGKFAGVSRRFDIKGIVNDVAVIDDYGHHPVEIRATLEAAKVCKFNRLLVLFQPHRFSRSQQLWSEFTLAFNLADLLIVTDIYAAGELPIPGVSGESLAKAIGEAGHKRVYYLRSMQDAIERLLKAARPTQLPPGKLRISKAIAKKPSTS